MKLVLIILGLVFTVSSCHFNKKNKEKSEPKTANMVKLEPVWSTDTVFKTPESVLYDYARDVIYVSNVNKNPWEKDGNGFISKIDLQGNIIELEWIIGVDSPKGMGLVDSVLYVANVDEVIRINVNNGKIIHRIPFENEGGLNDITVGDMGEVYVSSTSNSRVYEILDNKYTVLNQGENEGFNGLYYDSEQLLILTNKTQQLKSYKYASGEVTVLASGLGAADGIVALEKGGYITSDWNGEIFYINNEYEVKSLLDTKNEKMNTADIEYIQKDSMLLVPTFFDNRVLAYRVVKE